MPFLRLLFLFGLGLLLAPPARALDLIEIHLSLLETDLSVRVSELRSPQSLLQGNSDLAQLN